MDSDSYEESTESNDKLYVYFKVIDKRFNIMTQEWHVSREKPQEHRFNICGLHTEDVVLNKNEYGIYDVSSLKAGDTWITVNGFDARKAVKVPLINCMRNLKESLENWKEGPVTINIKHNVCNYRSVLEFSCTFGYYGKYDITRKQLTDLLEQYTLEVSDNKFINPASIHKVLVDLKKKIKKYRHKKAKNDRNIITNQEIGQSGLAHIGPATNGNHCSLSRHFFTPSM